MIIKIKETRNFYDEINEKYHIDLNELVKRNCQEDNPLSQHQDVSTNKFCELILIKFLLILIKFLLILLNFY